jgi:hypothetical protein
VLDAVDDPTVSWHDAIGSAHTWLAPASGDRPDRVAEAARAAEAPRVEALLDRHGWELEDHSPHRTALAAALASLATLGHLPTDEVLDTYAEAAAIVAEIDVASVEEVDRASAAEHAVVGTLLLEPVLLTLRRIAQENASRRSR